MVSEVRPPRARERDSRGRGSASPSSTTPPTPSAVPLTIVGEFATRQVTCKDGHGTTTPATHQYLSPVTAKLIAKVTRTGLSGGVRRGLKCRLTCYFASAVVQERPSELHDAQGVRG